MVFFFLWDSIQDEEGNNFLIINDFAEEIQIPTKSHFYLGKTSILVFVLCYVTKPKIELFSDVFDLDFR